MALAKALFFWLTCHLLLQKGDSKCQRSFSCGNFNLEFPFTDIRDRECGLFPVDGCDSKHEHPKAHIGGGRIPFAILSRVSENKLLMHNVAIQAFLDRNICPSLSNMSLTNSPSVSFTFAPNLTLFECFKPLSERVKEYFQDYGRKECQFSTAYYNIPTTSVGAVNDSVGSIPSECHVTQLPGKHGHNSTDLFSMLTADFTLEWSVSGACSKCFHGGGQCLTDIENRFYCKQGKKWLELILAISISGAGVLLLLLVAYIIWLRKKKLGRRHLLSRNIASNLSGKLDIESGIFCFGMPVFSYAELKEATDNFDASKEVGDGGFGTVYHGQLRDGREVAIKRMYEHNYRRMEHFLNEIKILTGLRHPNLVSLYGCTSRRSRELLLVYEYISNGTVADHLHGERAKEASLTWPARMSIAIETATALAYLHKSDVIHRDVKTSNILLDSSFGVKVADFGLSRLVPNDVTHISTAPQGTPGYVDPEYHHCYQLTDKSDVYSFGVVLIELISSMPAVDTSRHRHEINLANLALKRIQRGAFDELIDLSLGYESDPEVTRMTTMVAELAFRCLQMERDLRPSMEEVVAFLGEIQSGDDCNFEEIKEANCGYNHAIPGNTTPSTEKDDAALLKDRNFQSSPNSVVDRWVSLGSTTVCSID